MMKILRNIKNTMLNMKNRLFKSPATLVDVFSSEWENWFLLGFLIISFFVLHEMNYSFLKIAIYLNFFVLGFKYNSIINWIKKNKKGIIIIISISLILIIILYFLGIIEIKIEEVSSFATPAKAEKG